MRVKFEKFEQSHLDKIKSFFSDTSPQKITIFSGLGIFVIFLLCTPIFCFLWKQPILNNRAAKFCCGLVNPCVKWKVSVEHKRMEQQLEEIKNEQIELLAQPQKPGWSKSQSRQFLGEPHSTCTPGTRQNDCGSKSANSASNSHHNQFRATAKKLEINYQQSNFQNHNKSEAQRPRNWFFT